MKVCILSGGTGAPKLIQGLKEILPEEDISVIVNTGEDTMVGDLYLSPDIDTVLYTLSNQINEDTWYGVKEDTFITHNTIKEFESKEDSTFGENLRIGDKDRALKMHKTHYINKGYPLSKIIKMEKELFGIKANIFPMTDNNVKTKILINENLPNNFQGKLSDRSEASIPKSEICEFPHKCRNPIIAEIKVHSPKYGNMINRRDEMDILRIYENAGAAGISYITDKEYFNGDFNMFKKICENTELPVLRKDFITTKDEIEKTAEVGGGAILLIARLLKEETAEFVDYALEHGLDTLVEVHNKEEIDIAKETNSTMIGVNNRDITKLELDDGTVSLTEHLAPLIPKNMVFVSESGIGTIEDLRMALKYADAALIGTSFMRARNIEEFVKSFVEAKL